MTFIKEDYLEESTKKWLDDKNDKYVDTLNRYNLDIDDNKVRETVRNIIAEKAAGNDTLDVKRFLFGSIELTSLKTTDSDTSILALTERVPKTCSSSSQAGM